jgi:glycosyltransferase involved in cell wall biosynthesis
MRILVATWSSRQVGGTETYLGRIMALLAAAGHEIAFGFETDDPAGRAHVPLPGGTPSFRLTTGDGTAAARAWTPAVIFVHGLLDPSVEEALLHVAPAVFFAHAYYGTCISGEKTHKFPIVQPCTRRFGPACLALYYPRRCGGLNPLTATRDYARQRRRRALLEDYAAVVTASSHMQQELSRHGAAGGRVVRIPFTTGADRTGDGLPPPRGSRPQDGPWQLLFAGRMDRLKGGAHLLDALALISSRLSRPVRMVFAGDGPDRDDWQRRASAITRGTRNVGIEFAGWLEQPQLSQLLDGADLLVMPSLWPEPFGLIGPEANRRGVPVAAYATGGIPEWLTDGVNGALASAAPPTVAGLADAIVRCLERLSLDDSLRQGALARAQATTDNAHVAALVGVLAQASAQPLQRRGPRP